jgi:hypothetical protein
MQAIYQLPTYVLNYPCWFRNMEDRFSCLQILAAIVLGFQILLDHSGAMIEIVVLRFSRNANM